MPRKLGSLQYRANVPARVHDAIARRSCWHCDAWLIQSDNDELYFVIETRAGGAQLLDRRVIHVRADGTTAPATDSWTVEGVARHINSPWARKAGLSEALERIHWQQVQPYLRADRDGFTHPYSIALHYVWSDPAVSEPCEGLRNMYEATGRAARDDARRKTPAARPPMPSVGAPAAWTTRERSQLRTLDKLLK